MIRLEILGGVFRAIFDLRPHLVIVILNLEPFVTRVIDMDATVKRLSYIFFIHFRSCRQSTAKDSMLPGGSVVDLSRNGTLKEPEIGSTIEITVFNRF